MYVQKISDYKGFENLSGYKGFENLLCTDKLLEV